MTDLHCHSIRHQFETMTLIECGIATLFGYHVDIEIRAKMLLCLLYQSGGNTLLLIIWRNQEIMQEGSHATIIQSPDQPHQPISVPRRKHIGRMQKSLIKLLRILARYPMNR